MNPLDKFPGWKTYGMGIGLIGLGAYQISQGQPAEGITSILAGLGLLFARRAVDRPG